MLLIAEHELNKYRYIIPTFTLNQQINKYSYVLYFFSAKFLSQIES